MTTQRLAVFLAAIVGVAALATPAPAKTAQSQGHDSKSRASAARLHGHGAASQELSVDEVLIESIDLPEPVTLREDASLSLQRGLEPARGVVQLGVDQAGRVAGPARSDSSRTTNEERLGSSGGLVDAVGEGKVRWDGLGRGLAKDADREPARIVFGGAGGRFLGLGRLIRERENRVQNASPTVPKAKTLRKAASAGIWSLVTTVTAAGVLNLLAAGTALAETGVAISPALMTVPGLLAATAIFAIPPVVLSTLPPQIMGIVQTRIYKEIKTVKKLFGVYTYSQYDRLSEETLVHHYERLYETAKLRYPNGYGWNKKNILDGMKDPAELKVPENAKEERERILKEIRRYTETLDLRLEQLDTNRATDLGIINYLIGILLGVAATFLQYNGFLTLDPNIGSLFSAMLTGASVGAGAYLWYRNPSAGNPPPSVRLEPGPKGDDKPK